jgi:hypothetical protein
MAAAGDCPYMGIRTAGFEGSVSKQMVVKTDQSDAWHPQTTRHPQTKSRVSKSTSSRIAIEDGCAEADQRQL